MSDDSQLDRIEAKVDKALSKTSRVETHLAEINGRVGRHDQSLYGMHGRGGLVDDVRSLIATVRPQGTVATRTMWSAVAALSGVAAVVVALIVGMT